MQRYFLTYLLVFNVATFFIYGLDKWKAKHHRQRIPEARLLGYAMLGGSIGAWLGMVCWRHKTKHNQFRYGIPAILVLQLLAVLLLTLS